MDNSRIIYIENLHSAIEEIRKVGVDAGSLPWLAPKAVHIKVRIDNVSSFAANVIKQEMLGKGGDVAVNRGVAGCTVEKTSILIMGTLKQYKSLVAKLYVQAPSLKEIAKELEQLVANVENGKPKIFECGKYRLPLGEKTYTMGILNVTPDSFSDGGLYYQKEAAIKHAKEMVANGADIIDVGGESTRLSCIYYNNIAKDQAKGVNADSANDAAQPGYQGLDPFEEINRIVPVIEVLAKELSVPISVDTSKAIVAQRALEAGASIVNDVWGFQRDEDLAKVVSDFSAGAILMHHKIEPRYDDVMGDIIKYLRNSISIAEKAGIRRENIMIDPGIGFGKTTEHSLEVMRRLKELETLAVPVLVGSSRKSMIGNVLELPFNERIEGTAATVTLAIANGADVVRVHDVKEMSRVIRMTDAMVRA